MSGGVYVTKKQQSYSADGIIMTTYADDYIVRGDAYNVVSRHTLASGASIKLVMDFTGVRRK